MPKRNVGRYIKRACDVCGKEIWRNERAVRAFCSNEHRIAYGPPTKITWPTQAELQAMLKETSYPAVSKKLGVAVSTIRRRLKNNLHV